MAHHPDVNKSRLIRKDAFEIDTFDDDALTADHPLLRGAVAWSWPSRKKARFQGLAMQRSSSDSTPSSDSWSAAFERALGRAAPASARRIVLAVVDADASAWCAAGALACSTADPPISFAAVDGWAAVMATAEAMLKQARGGQQRSSGGPGLAAFNRSGGTVEDQLVASLQHVPQIGAKSAMLLLREHKSLVRLVEASDASLTRTLGSEKKARMVRAWLHAASSAPGAGGGSTVSPPPLSAAAASVLGEGDDAFESLVASRAPAWCIAGRAIRVKFKGAVYDATVERVTEGDATSHTRRLKVRYTEEGSFERIPWRDVSSRVSLISPPTSSVLPPPPSRRASRPSRKEGATKAHTVVVPESDEEDESEPMQVEESESQPAEQEEGSHANVSWQDDADDDGIWGDDDY